MFVTASRNFIREREFKDLPFLAVIFSVTFFLFTLRTFLIPQLFIDGDINRLYLRTLRPNFLSSPWDVPLFAPNLFMGHPMASDPASGTYYWGTYLLTLLNGFGDISAGFLNFSAYLILTIGAFIMYYCCRSFGTTRTAGTVAALAWFIAPMTFRVAQFYWVIFLIPLLPAVFHAFRIYSERLSWTSAAYLFLAWSLLLNLPHPQFRLFAMYIVAPYFLFRGIEQARIRSGNNASVWIVAKHFLLIQGPVVLAGINAMILLFEHSEFSRHTFRGDLPMLGFLINDDFFYVKRLSLFSKGTLADHLELLMLPPFNLLSSLLVSFFVALRFPWRWWKHRDFRFFWIASCFLLLLWAGDIGIINVTKFVFDYLPFSTNFRNVYRVQPILIFTTCMLLAFWITELEMKRWSRFPWRRVFVLFAVVLISATLWRVWDLGWFAHPELYYDQFRSLDPGWRWMFSIHSQLAILILGLIFTFVAFEMTARAKGRWCWQFAIIGILVLAWLGQTYGYGITFRSDSSWDPIMDNTAAEADSRLVRTWAPETRPFFDLRAEADPFVGSYHGNFRYERIQEPITLSLLYALQEPANFYWDFRTEPLGILMNAERIERGLLPRAYSAFNYCEYARAPGQTLNGVNRVFFGDLLTIWGERPLKDFKCIEPRTDTSPRAIAKNLELIDQSARLNRSSNNWYEYDVDAGLSGGFLQLTQGYYPGWHARVDGKETPIINTFGYLMAVQLKPGKHQVSFYYRPWLVIVHTALTGIALLLFCLMALKGESARKIWPAFLIAVHMNFVAVMFVVSTTSLPAQNVKDHDPQPYIRVGDQIVGPKQILHGVDSFFTLLDMTLRPRFTGAMATRRDGLIRLKISKNLVVRFKSSAKARVLFGYAHSADPQLDCNLEMNGYAVKLFSGCGVRESRLWTRIANIPPGVSEVRIRPPGTIGRKNPGFLAISRLAVAPPDALENL